MVGREEKNKDVIAIMFLYFKCIGYVRNTQQAMMHDQTKALRFVNNWKLCMHEHELNFHNKKTFRKLFILTGFL